LHIAIWKGFLPLAAALLQAGANPNIIDGKNISFVLIGLLYILP